MPETREGRRVEPVEGLLDDAGRHFGADARLAPTLSTVTKRSCSCSTSTQPSVAKSSRWAGVPPPRDLTLGAAGSLTDPRTGKSASRRLDHQPPYGLGERCPAGLADLIWDHGSSANGAESSLERSLSPRWAGSAPGSDYTAFVDHLGVPAVDGGLKGGYGVYHSIYDDFNWMEKFGDPEFLSHATAARLYTLDRHEGCGGGRGAAHASCPTAGHCATTSTSCA